MDRRRWRLAGQQPVRPLGVGLEVRRGAASWAALRGAARAVVAPGRSWPRRVPGADLRVDALATRAGARLAGEVDLTTRPVLAAALDAAIEGDGDVHLDLTGLDFIDVGGATLLVGAAGRLGPDRRLVLHRPPGLLRRMLGLLWPVTPGIEVVA